MNIQLTNMRNLGSDQIVETAKSMLGKFKGEYNLIFINCQTFLYMSTWRHFLWIFRWI